MNNIWENILSATSALVRVIKMAFDRQIKIAGYTAFLVGILVIPQMVNAQEVVRNDSSKFYLHAPVGYSENPYFSTELNFEDFADFGDISLSEALIRVPGFQSSRDGEINIRGVGYHSYGVSFNGLRLANTGMGTRNINPSDISLDGIQKVEITKVLDPSMDADALGGLINLNSDKVLSEGSPRSVSAMVGGEANTTYISRTGPGSRGWLKYAERFSDELSVSLNLGYHQAINSWEELQLDFGAQNFENGFVDVFNRVSPAVRINEQGRFTTSADVFFTPDQENSYNFRAYLNSNDQTFVSHQDSWITGGDFIDQSTTGADGEEGSFMHEASRYQLQSSQLAIQGGGEHDFERFMISYNAGWSQGRSDNQDYTFPFRIEGLNYALNLETKNRPEMTFTNREVQILDDGTVDRQFMIGQNFERTLQEHVNNLISLRTDIEIPISSGTLKAGLSSRFSAKEGTYNESSFEYNRTLRMISFNMLREPNRDIEVMNDNYRIPWFVNTSNARDFLESQRPLFTGDDLYNAYQSEIRNYTTTEQIYATYAMGEFKFGDLDLKAGLRAEFSNTDLEGNQISFDENGDIGVLEDDEQSESMLALFPNLQVKYGISNQNSIQAAYSRTIDRIDYFPQTPFSRIHNQDSTIFRGNPGLEPVTSDNIDLKFEQKMGDVGLFTLAGFYKMLNNFVEQRQQVVSAGSQYAGYEQMGFVNSDETAAIYGVEVTLEQRLLFLPGLLNNLGIYANYTWSRSNYRSADGRDKMMLTGHSPHVFNGALNYQADRFKAQISYHWSEAFLSDIAIIQQRAPALGTGTYYLDRYEDGHKEMSVTASYQLADRFRVWVNANHLMNVQEISYGEERSDYPLSTYQRSGLDLRIGVRFDL
ncbi:outer membrane beta-barrel protein [Gracilimonas sp.]|uniref:outer membrane beta-barrel protein n=1 Tax=Gracilimonas sp. TaxID=1974203 RepID=UPI003BA9A8D3